MRSSTRWRPSGVGSASPSPRELGAVARRRHGHRRPPARVRAYRQHRARARGRPRRSRRPVAAGAPPSWWPTSTGTSFRPAYEARRARPVLAGLRCVTRATARRLPATRPWVERLRDRDRRRPGAELATLLQREVAETMGFDSPRACRRSATSTSWAWTR